MSAKVYSGIEGIEPPKFSFEDFENYQKACEDYCEELRKRCRINSNSDLAGEIIGFPVADGRAEYMVYGTKPLELIHIDTMDGYQFDHVDLMTVQRVREMVEREKALAKLFGNR